MLLVLAPIDSLETAMSEMSEQFVIGTMKGSFIHKLSPMFDGVMKQILNHQLLVPIIHEKNVLEMTTADSDDNSNNTIDFSRPTDYRMKVIEAEQTRASLDESRMSGPSRVSTRGTASSESIKAEVTPYEGK